MPDSPINNEWSLKYIKLLIERQTKNAKEINKYTDGLNAMYEKEMGKLTEDCLILALKLTLKFRSMFLCFLTCQHH